MSIFFADFPSGSPGLYTTDEAAMLDGIYAEIGGATGAAFQLIDDPDPNVSGGRVAAMTGASGDVFLRYVHPQGNLTEVGFAFRLWMPELPSQTGSGTGRKTPIIQWRSVANSAMVTVWVSTTGQIVVSTGDQQGSEIGRTTIPVLVARAWQHVEINVVQSDTVGSVEVRVEGVTKLNLTNVNTGASPYAQMVFGIESFGNSATFGAGSAAYKDCVWWDTNGTENVSFLGSVQVYDLVLDGDESLGWTPSTGSTGYDLINETPPDDLDYISADASPPPYSEFTFGDLPSDVVGVRGLVSIARMRKTDGGDANVQMSFMSEGDEDFGADRPITTAFTYYYDVSELSPDTAAPWNPIEVNNATVRINRTL
jgi:hypothetical protein